MSRHPPQLPVYAGDLVGGTVVHDDDDRRSGSGSRACRPRPRKETPVHRAAELQARKERDPVVTGGVAVVFQSPWDQHPFATRTAAERALDVAARRSLESQQPIGDRRLVVRSSEPARREVRALTARRRGNVFFSPGSSWRAVVLRIRGRSSQLVPFIHAKRRARLVCSCRRIRETPRTSNNSPNSRPCSERPPA